MWDARTLTKRRQAIEPIIGHLKADHRMERCLLKGERGDRLHAVLCAAGFNIKRLLRTIAKKGAFLRQVYLRLGEITGISPNWLRMLGKLLFPALNRSVSRLAFA